MASAVTGVEFSLVVESFTLDEGGDWERYRAVLADAVAIAERDGAGEVLAIDATGLPEVSTMLAAEFPGVRAVDAVGRGYDGGKMEAALVARGTYVLYLDGDCLPQPGWSSELLAALRSRAADAVGGYTRYEGGFLAAVQSVMDFGFMYPLRRRPLKCYASNNAGFRRERLVEVPLGDGSSVRCSCYRYAQRLARRGTPMLLVPEARVLHEMQPVVRERTRQGYDTVAACWDDPGIPEARWVRLNVLAIPLFYGMNVLLDWRRTWSARKPLGLGPLHLLAALPLFPLYRLLDVVGMLRAFVGGRAEGGWQGAFVHRRSDTRA